MNLANLINRAIDVIRQRDIAWTGTETHAGQATFNDLIETDFNPADRVWVRGDFHQRIYTAAVVSDWSVFKSAASADMDWVLSKSGSGLAAVSTDGGCYLDPGKSATSGFVFVKPRTGGRFNKIKWNTSKSPRFRLVLRTVDASHTNMVLGLYSGSVAPNHLDAGGAGHSNRVEVFHLGAISTSNSWRVQAGLSAGSSSAATGVVAEDATVYDIEIRVSSSRIITVYINSTLVYTSTVPLAANTPLVPIIGVQPLAASSKKLGLFHVQASQKIAA